MCPAGWNFQHPRVAGSPQALIDVSSPEWFDNTLHSMDLMHHQGMLLSLGIIYCFLQECTKRKDVAACRRLHSLMVSSGLAPIAYLGDHLIRLFASCGDLLEANLVFCTIATPSLYTWHAIISAYSMMGENEQALQLFHKMQNQSIKPGKYILSCILKTCGTMRALGPGRLLQNQMLRSGLEADVVLGSSLVAMYTKCGSLDEARNVFDKLSNQNVVLWGAMITGYIQHGQGLLALELFEKMQQQGMAPDKVLFLCILKACSSIGAIKAGRLIHSQTVTSNFELCLVVGCSLVDLYAKCGSVEEAQRVFNKLPVQNVVSWGALISGYAQHGYGLTSLELFERMLNGGVKPDNIIFSCILKACGSIGAIGQGRLIHEQIIRNKVEPDLVVASALVELYANGESLDEAQNVFARLQNRNVVSWNAIISGYVQRGEGLSALELLENMQEVGMKPDKVTFLLFLKACCGMRGVEKGRLIHEMVIQSGYESDEVVGTTLVHMYAKCGSLQEAQKVFGELQNEDCISWAAMIVGLAQHGQCLSALDHFNNMENEDFEPNKITLSCILKVCGTTKALGQGKLVHDQIIVRGLEADVVVGSALVDMYAKFGHLEEAHQLLEELPSRNIFSWNFMMAGYILHEQGLLALPLFKKIQEDGINPDKVTFLYMLKACGMVGALELGKQIHEEIFGSAHELDVVLSTALVDMYAKCGSLDLACQVFYELPSENAVSWSTMIAGCARHGRCGLAEQCLEEMQSQGLKPEERTYTSMLAACSHVGQVQEGHMHFKSMREDHGIAPKLEHLNGVVDLLCRAGCLLEAQEYLLTMSMAPDVTAWTSLLTACRTYGNIELGRKSFEHIVLLDPNFATGYAIMSNIYANAHMWEDAHKIHEMKKIASAWKTPGKSWIEVNEDVHEFTVGDGTHSQVDQIYAKLWLLKNQSKEEGYIPQLDIVEADAGLG